MPRVMRRARHDVRLRAPVFDVTSDGCHECGTLVLDRIADVVHGPECLLRTCTDVTVSKMVVMASSWDPRENEIPSAEAIGHSKLYEIRIATTDGSDEPVLQPAVEIGTFEFLQQQHMIIPVDGDIYLLMGEWVLRSTSSSEEYKLPRSSEIQWVEGAFSSTSTRSIIFMAMLRAQAPLEQVHPYTPLYLEFSLATKQWRDFEWRLCLSRDEMEHRAWIVFSMHLRCPSGPPMTVSSSHITTSEGRYILRLAGLDLDEKRRVKTIQVYDTVKKECGTSGILCPFSEAFESCLVRNRRAASLLTTGWIRSTLSPSNARLLKRLPVYMQRLMTQWVNVEEVHLTCTEFMGGGLLSLLMHGWLRRFCPSKLPQLARVIVECICEYLHCAFCQLLHYYIPVDAVIMNVPWVPEPETNQ